MSHHSHTKAEVRAFRSEKRKVQDERRTIEATRKEKERDRRSLRRKTFRAQQNRDNRIRYVDTLVDTVKHEKPTEGIWRRAAHMLRFLGLGAKVPTASAESKSDQLEAEDGQASESKG